MADPTDREPLFTEQEQQEVRDNFRWLLVRRRFNGMIGLTPGGFGPLGEGPFTIDEAETLAEHLTEFFDMATTQLKEINRRLDDKINEANIDSYPRGV